MTDAANYLEEQIGTHLLRTGVWPKPAGIFVALFTTMPAEDGSGGVEVSGGSNGPVTSPSVTLCPSAAATVAHSSVTRRSSAASARSARVQPASAPAVRQTAASSGRLATSAHTRR